MDKYYESLGVFVTMFAEVETRLQQVLWHFAGIKPPVAPAVFSGTRVEAAMGLIKRIADAEAWSDERKGELQHVFSQLGELNSLRNDLLHYGSFWESESDRWVITNDGFVHTPQRLKHRVVSRQMWRDAVSDLLTIFNFLYLLAWGDQIRGDQLSYYREALTHAWHYRSQQQAAKDRKS